MNSDKNDIKIYSAEDITRYWQGKLSPAEMHAIESAAMDDPFLADALEGYSTSEASAVSNDVKELQTRLHERVNPSRSRPATWWRVAAILVFLAGAGALSYKLLIENRPVSSDLAKSDFSEKEQAVLNPAENSASTRPASDSAAPARIDSGTGNLSTFLQQQQEEKLAAGEGFRSTQTPSGKLLPVSVDNANRDLAKLKQLDDSSAYTKPDLKRENVKSDSILISLNETKGYTRDAQGRANAQNNNQPSARGRNLDDSNQYLLNNFSGRVVDQQNIGIPHASVRVNNNNQAAATNNEGYFLLRSPDTTLDLSVGSVGFQTRQFTLRSNQPSEVVLDPAAKGKEKSLAEVVVTGNGNPKKSMKQSDLKVYPMEAQPEMGWDQYNQYLEKNKQTDSTMDSFAKGDVIISFTVGKNGKLSAFEVEKSLGKTQDAEALRLIKTGPPWKLLKGKKTKARVIVRF